MSGEERDERKGGGKGGGADRFLREEADSGNGESRRHKKAYIQTASAQVSVTQPSRLITKHRLPSFGPFLPPMERPAPPFASRTPSFLGSPVTCPLHQHCGTRPSGYIPPLSEAAVHKEVAP